jgi:hypothetical protein
MNLGRGRESKLLSFRLQRPFSIRIFGLLSRDPEATATDSIYSSFHVPTLCVFQESVSEY